MGSVRVPSWVGNDAPIGASLFVDAVNGSDSRGARGKQQRPFLTIQAALDAASAGDVVRAGPGTFDIGSDHIVVPDNVQFWGAGMDATTIVSTRIFTAPLTSGRGAIFIPGTNFVGGDFTVQGLLTKATSVAPIGFDAVQGDQASTKATFYRVRTNAFSDGIYFRPDMNALQTTRWRFFNSVFDSGFDNIQVAPYPAQTIGTWDMICDFIGCQHNSTGVATATSNMSGASNLTAGTFRLFGCSVNVVGVSTSGQVVGFSTDRAGHLELYGCGLNFSSGGASTANHVQVGVSAPGTNTLKIANTTGIDWSTVPVTTMASSKLTVTGGPTITATDPAGGTLVGYLGQLVLYDSGGGYNLYVCTVADPNEPVWQQLAATA